MAHPSPSLRIVLRERGADGTLVAREGPLFSPSDSAEPGVLYRLSAGEEGAGIPVITAFAAADAPPPSYPQRLPFVPGVRVFVTEQTDGSRPPVARWLCSDPDPVIEVLLAHSRAEGWKGADRGFPCDPMSLPLRSVLLRRGSSARMLTASALGGECIVQLRDFPEDALRQC